MDDSTKTTNNGAIGTVVKIVYNNRPEGPNDKEHYHMPDNVVVDFPNLKLPDGPTVGPESQNGELDIFIIA